MIWVNERGFRRALFVDRPAEVDTDEKADEYVSGLMKAAGTVPPAMELGAPILCRSRDKKPLVRISFYGVEYAICGKSGTPSITMTSMYAAYIERLKGILRRMGLSFYHRDF